MSASPFFFFLLTACGAGDSGLHAKSVCCSTAHPHTRGLILSASDGIWNMLFSTYSHTLITGKIKWFLLQSSLSLVVAQASAICSNCLHRLPNCLLSVMIMCAAVSEEAAASDILVGAQQRIRCWARTRSSSSDLVDTATASGRSAARVGLQFPFRS